MRRLLLLALLAACGGGTSGPSTGGGSVPDGGTDGGYPTAVTINWTLAAESNPVTTTVAAGTPVQWHNSDGTTHTVTPNGSGFPATVGAISAGATSATQTPTTPGTYTYHCSIHPLMHGTIIVQ